MQRSSSLTTLEYQPHELLVQNELEQARRESRAPDSSRIPKGGRVRLHLHSHDPHATNPKNYDFVVADKNGQVVKQETGSDHPPVAPADPRKNRWEGTHTIDLQTPLRDQVNVHVVNKIDKSKEDYTISHPSFKPQPAPHIIDKDHPPGPAPVMP